MLKCFSLTTQKLTQCSGVIENKPAKEAIPLAWLYYIAIKSWKLNEVIILFIGGEGQKHPRNQAEYS